MAATTTTTGGPLKNVNSTVAIVAYVSVAVGLLLILGVTFCVLRRIRVRRARKYIKQQRNHSIAMGPVLKSQPPSAPWKWKEVKANIKARRKGEERPYSGYGRKPEVSVISNGDSNVVAVNNAVNRPQSANGSVQTLGPTHKEMHGNEKKVNTAHHVKHERLERRRQAKIEKQNMKERQKEIKKDLTLLLEETVNGTFVPTARLNGQSLPGDEFPTERNVPAASNSSITHVGPLRRDSLQEIPNITYLIEQSPRDKPMHRTTGRKHLDVPQNLCTWEEERESKSSTASLPAIKGSPRHVVSEVTVHHVTDKKVDGEEDVTEL